MRFSILLAAAAFASGVVAQQPAPSPTPQQPATQQPATQQPETQQPAAQKPAAQQPGATPATPQGAAKPASAAAPSQFTPERLEQLVAPIALYPDGLLAQVLMASTYPL